MKSFDKILIANRGEIAVRIIRTAKRMGIQTVAIYASDDANLPHVSLADSSFLLEGVTLAETYLNQQEIIRLAKENRAEAIHPGYGFLSENSDFAALVEKEGLVFIGATSAQIELMGDKTKAVDFVKELDVPIIPGVHGAVNDIISKMSSLSFPVLVKASAGGGGKGMQIVHSVSELPIAMQKAQRQATEYFSNGGIFVEKYIPKARHIEIQVFGDGEGSAVHLFERECSIQRRHQKLIEEAPAISISNNLKEKLFNTALKITNSIHYRGAGTIEFLVDEDENFYFLEMNTRLQVEHPVTEMITGLDLVEWQIQIAAGNGLLKSQSEIHQDGHAIELRLCAEDPVADFHPVAGTISQFKNPSNIDFRFDNFIVEGMQVSSNYDSLLGKLIISGNNRNEVIEKLLSVSEEVMLTGFKSNLPFLRQILKHKSFQQNNIDTCFVESHFEQLKDELIAERNELQKTIPQIAYCLYHFHNHDDGSLWQRIGYQRFLNEFNIELEGKINILQYKNQNSVLEFQIDENMIHVSEINVQEGNLSFNIDDKKYDVLLAELDGFSWIQIEGHQFKLRSNHVLTEAVVNKNNEVSQSANVKNIYADLYGKVIKTHVKKGDDIQKNKLLLTIESMKTEFRILSPIDGMVKQLHVDIGSVVQDKQLLIEFEPKNKIIITA